MEYMILEEESSGELERVVNSYLEDGWQLQGGVSVATWHDENGMEQWTYVQAIVREVVE